MNTPFAWILGHFSGQWNSWQLFFVVYKNPSTVIELEKRGCCQYTVFENHKKSHSALRAKRATFALWVDKSSLKIQKYQKWKYSNETFWVIFKHCAIWPFGSLWPPKKGTEWKRLFINSIMRRNRSKYWFARIYALKIESSLTSFFFLGFPKFWMNWVVNFHGKWAILQLFTTVTVECKKWPILTY